MFTFIIILVAIIATATAIVMATRVSNLKSEMAKQIVTFEDALTAANNCAVENANDFLAARLENAELLATIKGLVETINDLKAAGNNAPAATETAVVIR